MSTPACQEVAAGAIRATNSLELILRATYTGTARPGQSSGSCFSALFGGACSGTPPECKECKEVVDCSKEQVVRPQVESKTDSEKQCDFKCLESGGCRVTYVGPPRGGPVSGRPRKWYISSICAANLCPGSCFPAAFGGSCSGTPPECEACNVARTCVQPAPPTTPAPPPAPAPVRPLPTPQRPGPSPVSGAAEPCLYLCSADGGCQTRYTGHVLLLLPPAPPLFSAPNLPSLPLISFSYHLLVPLHLLFQVRRSLQAWLHIRSLLPRLVRWTEWKLLWYPPGV